MRGTFLIPVSGVMSMLLVGCMTSKSRCEIEYNDFRSVISVASEVNTERKYRIREVRFTPAVSTGDDSIMREMAGSFDSLERIMHTCPGVFESGGDEVFVNIVEHKRDSRHMWTMIPCILTVGICPYFQQDDTFVTAEVSLVDDPSRKARFKYREIDDWKVSFLFQLGLIPYPEGELGTSRIGKRGSGDVSLDVHREGFAVGIAKALKEIENKKR